MDTEDSFTIFGPPDDEEQNTVIDLRAALPPIDSEHDFLSGAQAGNPGNSKKGNRRSRTKSTPRAPQTSESQRSGSGSHGTTPARGGPAQKVMRRKYILCQLSKCVFFCS